MGKLLRMRFATPEPDAHAGCTQVGQTAVVADRFALCRMAAFAKFRNLATPARRAAPDTAPRMSARDMTPINGSDKRLASEQIHSAYAAPRTAPSSAPCELFQSPDNIIAPHRRRASAAEDTSSRSMLCMQIFLFQDFECHRASAGEISGHLHPTEQTVSLIDTGRIGSESTQMPCRITPCRKRPRQRRVSLHSGCRRPI